MRDQAPLDLGVLVGAQHRAGEETMPGAPETDVWLAHVPARGGRDDLANLVTLCAAHHQRGVHRGVIRISGRAPKALVFELPLCVYRSRDRAISPAPAAPRRSGRR